jgi:hypothetical protein
MKIDDILNSKPLPGKVLIETFGRNSTLTYGSLNLHVKVGEAIGASDMTATGDGEHMERSGIVIAACDRVEPTEKNNYETDIEVESGDEVWFSSSAFATSEREGRLFRIDDRTFIVMDYHRLYMKERNEVSQMLNGYMLLEPVEKKHDSIIHRPTTEYYSDVYRLAKRAEPIRYVDKYYDDPAVKEGDYVYTRFKHYPKLEELGHRYYSDKTYYIVQPKEIVGTVKLPIRQ